MIWPWISQKHSRCSSSAGVELAESDLDVLVERTEGWPAGLYLAALAINAGARARGRR